MSENSYINWELLNDEAIGTKIGVFLKRIRHQQGKTQQEVAKQADISRSTLSLLEAGESGSLKTLIKVLRVLQKLSAFKNFEFIEQFSPLALAEAQHPPIKRVRQKKTPKSTPKKSDW